VRPPDDEPCCASTRARSSCCSAPRAVRGVASDGQPTTATVLETARRTGPHRLGQPGSRSGGVPVSGRIAALRRRVGTGRPDWRVEGTGRQPPARPSVVLRGGRERPAGRRLLLCGHLDTVGLGGISDGLSPRVDGDRLYGRGAYDHAGAASPPPWVRGPATLLGAGDRRGGPSWAGRRRRGARQPGGAGGPRAPRPGRHRCRRGHRTHGNGRSAPLTVASCGPRSRSTGVAAHGLTPLTSGADAHPRHRALPRRPRPP